MARSKSQQRPAPHATAAGFGLSSRQMSKDCLLPKCERAAKGHALARRGPRPFGISFVTMQAASLEVRFHIIEECCSEG